MPSSPWLALLLALLPGLHAWLGARQLVARAQDPTFPELLLRRAQRSLVVLSVCLSLLLVLCLAGAFVYLRVQSTLTHDLDDRLENQAAQLVASLAWRGISGFPLNEEQG